MKTRPEKKKIFQPYGENAGYNQACEEWEEYHEEQIKEIREEHQRQTRELQEYWEGQTGRLLNGLRR